MVVSNEEHQIDTEKDLFQSANHPDKEYLYEIEKERGKERALCITSVFK